MLEIILIKYFRSVRIAPIYIFAVYISLLNNFRVKNVVNFHATKIV